MSRLEPRSLAEAAAAIADGTVSSVALTTAAIERARNASERLNAFIALEEDAALHAAEAADAAVRAGRPLGPLHGVPLAHKDMFDRAGKVTGCGSRIRAGHVAEGTATVVARLEAAGAIQIGRLNMSEFAMGPTGHNAHHGRAISPLDPARISGGSSSGSGAAVGGGVVLAALGSDTGGSIRLPAACCGVVGIKATQGRVSRHAAMGLSWSQDCIGPLATTVRDAWLILHLVSGADGFDPTCTAEPVAARFADDMSGLRIGMGGGFFVDGLTAEVEAAIGATRAALAKDAAVATVNPPEMGALGELANVVAMSEAASIHLDWMRSRPGDYGPQVRMRLSQGLGVPAPLYARALQMRGPMLQAFLATVFAACDVLVIPTMPFVAPLAAEVDVGAGPSMNAVVAAMTRFTRPISYLGLPAVTVPVMAPGARLPVGLQVVAPPWREDRAAAVAARIEDALSPARTDGTSPMRPAA